MAGSSGYWLRPWVAPLPDAVGRNADRRNQTRSVTFPISLARPIRHPGPPPATCDVVVIGGGVIGVMTAWSLAERGLRVTLCEKGRIGA